MKEMTVNEKSSKDKWKQYIGKRIGYIKVIGLSPVPREDGRYFRCTCDCNQTFERKASYIYEAAKRQTAWENNSSANMKPQTSCGCKRNVR